MTATAGDPVIWYSVPAAPPPLGVVVVVRWGGRPLLAARVMDPRTKRGEPKRVAWAHDGASGRVLLPVQDSRPIDPKQPWIGWHVYHGAPELWRPQDPERWQAPLPPPALVETPQEAGRMWSARQSYSAVEDMEAAEIAREREDFRAQAQAQAEVGPGGERVEPRWWRDPSSIVYEAAGSCTLRMVEGRICRALAWCGAGRGLTLHSRTPLSILARLAEEAAATEAGEDRLARFQPLRQDHDDFDLAMGWFAKIGAPSEAVPVNGPQVRDAWRLSKHQKVMWLRSVDRALSWSDIGGSLDRQVSGERARQLFVAGLGMCLRVANGLSPVPGRKPVDHMAYVRASNRAFHRQG